jgi:predicted metal-dependent phosphoesterase TrpH
MKKAWLLCDFHIHTRFSDGSLEPSEVVDLYGKAGFDAIAITDHMLDERCARDCARQGRVPGVQENDFRSYQQAIWQEARRAWEAYGMLVLPGAEVTNNTAKYHIVCLDIKEHVSPDLPVEPIVQAIHNQGAIAIACHPYQRTEDGSDRSEHLWKNHEQFAHLFDAWEVANRDDLFNVVGLKKFNYVANSDFHEPRHLYSWKTLLACDKNPEAIKDAIRRNDGVAIYLHRKKTTEEELTHDRH